MNGVSARTLHTLSTAGESPELRANSEVVTHPAGLHYFYKSFKYAASLFVWYCFLLKFFNSSIVLPLSSPSSNEEFSKVEYHFSVDFQWGVKLILYRV